MVILILVVLGLVFGSFINAFVWRHYRQAELKLKREELRGRKKAAPELAAVDAELAKLSISRGRSMCTHCGHILTARDLVPVISFVWLRGRCRYCGKRIEDTPLAELLTAVLFVLSYISWPLPLHGGGVVVFILWLVFVMGFVALILYDLRWFLLPHNIVLPLIGLAVAYVLVSAITLHSGLSAVAGAVLGAIIIGGLFFVLYQVSKGQWIGGGDITLGLLLGLLVGGPLKAFAVIFIASLIGTVVAVPMLVTGRASRSTKLPFGPFLIISGILVVLYGDRLINWYTGPLLDWLNSLFLS